jgi:hypothetical protein
MKTKLHELLAAEKTASNARDQLTKDTQDKFGKGENYFTGFTKTLKLIDSSDETTKLEVEKAARQDKALPTTVFETLSYYLEYWAKAEDVLFRKNLTNTRAVADLVFRDETIATAVPVDELMGLEARLTDLRKLATQIPTLDASREWTVDANAAIAGTWRTATPTVTTKTEKVMTPVVLYAATEHHPAQVKEATSDKVVGTFTTHHVSGATTAIQKAQVLAVLDDLVIAVKQARTRANSVEVEERDIGRVITRLLLAPLKNAPASNQG